MASVRSIEQLCYFQSGGGLAESLLGIHPKDHNEPWERRSLPLQLKGLAQTIVEWLDWDNRVMFVLRMHWVDTGEWHD